MRRALLLSCLALAIAAASAAEAGRKHYSILYGFTDPGGQGIDPADAPIVDAAGTFYGANSYGGASDMGTVWSFGHDGTLSVLHQFQGAPDDGNSPAGKLALGPDGALYGATFGGGTFDQGAVYRLVPAGSGWNFELLHSFCQTQTVCPDGTHPLGSLSVDDDGTIYGTTFSGGASGWGALFRIDPPANGGSWSYRVLYNFCSKRDCADGQVPNADLVLTRRGKIYGTTQFSGGDARGTIFSISSEGSHFRVLHAFAFHSGSDGYIPRAGLARDSHGVLYGTTQFDNGPHDCGTVYSFDPASDAFKTLYAFCAHRNDVGEPFNVPTVVENRSGIALYGMADLGKYSEGGLYRIQSPATPGDPWTEKVVYSFCATEGCPDGRPDNLGNLLHHQGAIYGTTADGGTDHGGVLFRWSSQP